MDRKIHLKNWWGGVNPISKSRKKKMQALLKNKDATFFSSDCTGGILYHDLNLQFRSPTVNLMMFERDFIKYVMNYENYNSLELEFYEDERYSCPCAKLGDIVIHFTHYESYKDAREKWDERKQRINPRNMFIFFYETVDVPVEELMQLCDIGARGILMFTYREYDSVPFALCIDKYKNTGKVGNFKKRSFISDEREYEKVFDFVRWLNESDGSSYDVSKYAL